MTGRKGQNDRLSSRQIALEVLLRVDKHQSFAAAVLESELSQSKLEKRDRNLTTELVLGTLRWQGALDHELSKVVSRPLSQLDIDVLVILRLGAYQLLGDLRIPPHAAVSESVEIIRNRRGRGASGLVNASLRKIARKKQPLDQALVLPPWIFETLEGQWGKKETLAFARNSVEQPWTGLRTEPQPPEVCDREVIRGELLNASPSAQVEFGIYSQRALRVKSLGPIADLDCFQEGRISVQDEGAQLCAMLLDVAPGQKILDACAGRGGKTTMLASLSLGRAQIWAADRKANKLKHIEKDFGRLNLPRGNLQTVTVDLLGSSEGLDTPYDRIFLDVPCSGTGTLARRPEIRWRLKESDIQGLAQVQEKLLERSLELLRPGGVLVYCSCSVLPQEGEDQIRNLANTSFRDSVVATRMLRLLPHKHGTDGFFAARLVRT